MLLISSDKAKACITTPSTGAMKGISVEKEWAVQTLVEGTVAVSPVFLPNKTPFLALPDQIQSGCLRARCVSGKEAPKDRSFLFLFYIFCVHSAISLCDLMIELQQIWWLL